MKNLRAVALSIVALSAFLPACVEREIPLEDLRYTGVTRMKTGQYVQAEAAFQDFVTRMPGDPYMRAELGKAQLKNGKPSEAAENLRIAYSQRPQDGETLDALAEALVQSKQYDECFRLLRTAAADRGTALDHIRLGKYALRMGDTDTARVAFLTAARIDRGRSTEPQLALCEFYTAINDRPMAVRRLAMAYYLAPEKTEVLEQCRALGVIAGPTFGIMPEEYVLGPAPAKPSNPSGSPD